MKRALAYMLLITLLCGCAASPGTAAGGATAFSEGLAVRATIDELLQQL